MNSVGVGNDLGALRENWRCRGCCGRCNGTGFAMKHYKYRSEELSAEVATLQQQLADEQMVSNELRRNAALMAEALDHATNKKQDASNAAAEDKSKLSTLQKMSRALPLVCLTMLLMSCAKQPLTPMPPVTCVLDGLLPALSPTAVPVPTNPAYGEMGGSYARELISSIEQCNIDKGAVREFIVTKQQERAVRELSDKP
ncbi:hypothetical protein PCI56_00980 [Plesiomonas shigelloides subsp. oncorhynchi]|nr:hypothetical protein [Plesiomonas shigelloides]